MASENMPHRAALLVEVDTRLSDDLRPIALERILGRSPLQRHLHSLAALGITDCAVTLLGSGADEWLAECRNQSDLVTHGKMRVSYNTGGIPEPGDDSSGLLVVKAETVFDPRIYRCVAGATTSSVVVDKIRTNAAASIGVGLYVGNAGQELSPIALRLFLQRTGGRANTIDVNSLPTYLPNLRRTLRPYWMVLSSEDDFRVADGMIMDSAQKGILDFPARYIHPVPENFFARLFSKTGVTPNQITAFTGVLAFVSTYLFATQAYGTGLLIAVAVNILDGVDGKLARVSLQSSRFGDRLDHILDVTFEFSWYLGLGWGLSRAQGNILPFQLGFGLIGLMLGARAISGVYKAVAAHQIHDHTAFDRAFRLVAGRRNIYIFMLLAGYLAGRFAESFYAVLAWGGVTLITYVVRTAVAFFAAPSERKALARAEP